MSSAKPATRSTAQGQCPAERLAWKERNALLRPCADHPCRIQEDAQNIVDAALATPT